MVTEIQLSEYGYMVLSQKDENETFGQQDIPQVEYRIGDSQFLTPLFLPWCEIKLG